ncbi:Tetratricopeptide repeat protein 23-like [Bienertia sinuspersici]
MQKKVVGMNYVDESDKDSSHANPKEGDLITPKSAMIDIQHQSKYNFTEWLDSLKHPITLLNNEQGIKQSNPVNEDEGKKQIDHKTQQPQQGNGSVQEGHRSQLNPEGTETREGNANQEVKEEGCQVLDQRQAGNIKQPQELGQTHTENNMGKGGTLSCPMDKMVCWNVRGANQVEKMMAIKHFLAKQQAGLVTLLETKVKAPNLGVLYRIIFDGWCFTSNSQHHHNGRIIVARNPNSFTVGIQHMIDQLVQCVVNPNGGGPEFYTTFSYAHNDAGAREKLWKDLEQLYSKMTRPWLLMGDFNCVINLEERLGSAVRVSEMDPPRRCFELCGLQDIPYSGHFYTWTNKQLAQDRVFSKLDRVLANETLMDKYDTGNAVFLTEGCSDHCTMVIRMDQGVGKGRKPFKYYKMWQSAADCTERIRNAWNTPIHGTSMFVVTQKLKQVKKSLKELNNTGYCSIQVEEAKAFNKLIQIQEHLHQNPLDNAAMEEERHAQQMYKTKNKAYISVLKQKAKIQWIRDGDENSALFHSSIKRRRLQNNVYAIKDHHGNWQDSPVGVEQAFVNYYQELLVAWGLHATDQLERILRWVNRTRNRKNMHTITWDSAIIALVYHIWKARNKVRHGGDKPTAAHMFNEIKKSVKEKVSLKNTNKMSREQIQWFNNL